MTRTITALEVQKRDKERVSVFLDGEFAFGLPLIEATKLRKGQELTEAEIETLRQIDAVTQALDYAVGLLARRPYSSAELRRKLVDREVAPPIIDEVLAKLLDLGYVDDLAFARYWVENRERFRPRGQRALQYELRNKGIESDIIDQVLAELDPVESARGAVQAKLHSLRGSTPQEFRNKLGSFLARRGFGYDVIREVIHHIIIELETENPDYFAKQEPDEE